MSADERIDRVAASANLAHYEEEGVRRYLDGAPHLKHAPLRELYRQLLVRVFDTAREGAEVPHVLDLGAGDGSATLPLLELGAKVTAVDLSADQLDRLRTRCAERFGTRLDVHCEDVTAFLARAETRYDLVVANSFLHHVPDYLALIERAIDALAPGGAFFSFQDPLRYDSLSRRALAFSNVAYFSWRIFRGDVFGGIARRLRRRRGVYLADSMHDNAEYHVTRNGVDQDAIAACFAAHRFDCEIGRYFSTPSGLFQRLGAGMRTENTFAVIARRRS